MPRDVISPTSSGLKAQTGKLTASLSNRITRKLIGAELERLFLEKFKFTLGSELVTNGDFSASAGWTELGDASINTTTGLATIDGTSQTSSIYQDALVNGKTYTLTFTVSSDNGTGVREVVNNVGLPIHSITGNGTFTVNFTHSSASGNLFFKARNGGSFVVDNVSVKEITKQAPVAAFSLRKLGNVSPYAARIRRSSDNTEAQVFFDASDRVSESSVVRNTSHNLLDYSEDFTQWIPLGSMTVSSASDITDPFGGTNSTKIVAPTGAGLKLLGPATVPTVSSGTTVTASLYVKNAGGRYVIFYLNDSSSRMLRVDLQTGTITSNTADSGTIEALDDDWYRISFTRTLDTNLGGVLICPSLDGTNVSFEGNGTDGLYIFGAMLEETVTYESTPSITYSEDFNADTGGWSDSEGGGSITTLSHETANPISGSGSLKINLTNTGTSSGYPRVRVYTGTDARTNVKYRLSFKAKLLSGTAKADIRFGTSSTNMYFKNQQVFSTDEQTYSYTETFDTLPTSGTDAIDFLFFGTLGPFELLIDDVKVEEFDPIPSEYISTPVVSNDGLTFTETTLDDFVGGENLLSYSEDFSQWTAENATVTSGQSDPNGGQDAYKLKPTASSQRQAIKLNKTITGDLTASVFAKKGEYDVLQITDARNGSFFVNFDLTNGTVGSSSGVVGKIEAVGNDGWFRCSSTFSDSTGNIISVRLSIATATDSARLVDFAGNGTDGLYIFGAQLNTDSLKDYQKTTGSARDGNAGIVVLYNQTGGEDAIQETPAEQPLLYKEGLLVRSGSSPAWYYRDKSSGNDDVLSIPSLTGLSRLDAFFVHEVGSDTTFMYPTGSATGGHWGMLAQSSSSENWQNYLSDDSSLVFVNGTQGSPTSRLEYLNLVNGRKLVHHQKGATTSWTHFNMSDYNLLGTSSNNPQDFKFCEWIFFDTNQSDNRVSIEKDINDFHNLF